MADSTALRPEVWRAQGALRRRSLAEITPTRPSRFSPSRGGHDGIIARTALLCKFRLSISIHWGLEVVPVGALEPVPARTRKHLDLLSGRPRPLSGENCTIVLTDVVAFGSSSRTEEDGCTIREALSEMTQVMMRGIAGVRSENRGDGIVTVVPPRIPTAYVIHRLLKELPPALRLHNSTHHDSAQFKLRAAVNVGPVTDDAVGVSGKAITIAARLVDAPLFKKAMDISRADLGLIVSTFVYETAITDDMNVPGYSQVQVEVKDFNKSAWMKLLDEASPHSGPNPIAALPSSFSRYSAADLTDGW